jgi:hypothetical protein
MNSDDVKRLRELEAAATQGEWLADDIVVFVREGYGQRHIANGVTPGDAAFLVAVRNHASDLLAAAEERDRMAEALRVLRLEKASVEEERDQVAREHGAALQAARELREALKGTRGKIGVPIRNERYLEAYDREINDLLASTAWLTDGGDNG